MKSAYELIKKESLLSGISLDIYEILSKNPDITVGEIYRKYQGKYPQTRRSRNDIAKRVTDLFTRDAVTTGDIRLCKFSGKKAKTYRLTSNLPKPLTPRFSSKTSGTAASTSADNSAVSSNTVMLNNAFPTQKDPFAIEVEQLALVESVYILSTVFSLLNSKAFKFLSMFMGKNFRSKVSGVSERINKYNADASNMVSKEASLHL